MGERKWFTYQKQEWYETIPILMASITVAVFVVQRIAGFLGIIEMVVIAAGVSIIPTVLLNYHKSGTIG